jgi:transposase
MIDYETFCQIHQLHQKGLKVSQIAEELKLDPKTVERWINQARYQPRQTPKRPSKLDPFKGQIVAMLERHPYTAQQILQQLRPQGYVGGYSILKEFVHRVRPPRKPAFLMLDFAPGECAQVDWGQFGSVQVGSTRRRLSVTFCANRERYFQEGRGENGIEWRVIVWKVSRSAMWSGFGEYAERVAGSREQLRLQRLIPRCPRATARLRGALSAGRCGGATRTGGSEEHILHWIGGLTGPTQLG